jgi:hypothetical protein
LRSSLATRVSSFSASVSCSCSLSICS